MAEYETFSNTDLEFEIGRYWGRIKEAARDLSKAKTTDNVERVIQYLNYSKHEIELIEAEQTRRLMERTGDLK